MVGATIMAHGDDRGLVLPPALAPYQVVLIPILPKAAQREPIMEACQRMMNEFKQSGIRAKLDARDDVSPGYKYNHWELRGVPLRLELGPRDLDQQRVLGVRRDTGEKSSLDLADLVTTVKTRLQSIQDNLHERNRNFREENTREIAALDELKEMFSAEGGAGLAVCFHCGSLECDKQIKDLLGVTNRCFPFATSAAKGSCIICGSPSSRQAVFGRAY
jgi:prolyl-tRNA synthetase